MDHFHNIYFISEYKIWNKQKKKSKNIPKPENRILFAVYFSSIF